MKKTEKARVGLCGLGSFSVAIANTILIGKKPETDGRSALEALALIRAAIESARTGRPADVESA